MDVDTRIRSLIYLVGIVIVASYILLSGTSMTYLLPLLLAVSIYIVGISSRRVLGSLFISGLVMLYMVLEGLQIYYIGVLFTLLAIVYEPRRSIYEHRVIYMAVGTSILIAAYLAVIYRFMGLPSLYRFLYLIWGGMLVVTWIYIFSAPKNIHFFDLTKFREYYLKFLARPKEIGIGITYLLLVGASITGGSIVGLLISLIGLYLIYRGIYSLHIAGLLILLYIMVSIFYGIDRAFIELDALIRSVGGWFG